MRNAPILDVILSELTSSRVLRGVISKENRREHPEHFGASRRREPKRKWNHLLTL